jgi:hypothetical protein
MSGHFIDSGGSGESARDLPRFDTVDQWAYLRAPAFGSLG